MQFGRGRRIVADVDLHGDRVVLEPTEDVPIAPCGLRHGPTFGTRGVGQVNHQPALFGFGAPERAPETLGAERR